MLEGTGRTPGEWQAAIDGTRRPDTRALPGVRVTLRAVNGDTTVSPSWNVAGLLPGSDPALGDETILVTSHYDHLGVQRGLLYPGANDNASGTIAMLEVARALAADRPARSVLFVSFGSEEQLMLGSYYYVAHPLRPLATTRAVLDLDMVGRNEAHTPESSGAYEVTAGRPDQLNVVGGVFSPDLDAVLAQGASRRVWRSATSSIATRRCVPCSAATICHSCRRASSPCGCLADSTRDITSRSTRSIASSSTR